MDDILDFLPIYPDINDKSFNNEISMKKEFVDNTLESYEKFPEKKGDLLKHQITISRFFSSNTLYDQLLLYHSMGTGKTCTSVACVEQIRREKSTFKGAIIFTSSSLLQQNYKRELILKCTAGQYYTKKRNKKDTISTKKIKDYYDFETFQTFAKKISKAADENIISNYSNYIIIIDEVHNIHLQNPKEEISGEKTYFQFHRFLHLIQNCKILLMSGTPVKDKMEEIADVMNLLLPLDKQISVKNDFLKEYFEKTDNFIEKNIQYKIKSDDARNKLKSVFQGRISYLKPVQSTIKKEYVGENNVNGLKKLVVIPTIMSDLQTKGYEKAYKKKGVLDEKEETQNIEDEIEEEDGATKEEKTKTDFDAFDQNSDYSSLFVYPDETFATHGFKLNVSESGEKKYELKKNLRNFLTKGKDNKNLNEEEILEQIGKCSCKYKSIIENILKAQREPDNKKCIFVYSKSVKTGGCILFSLLLKLFNFKEAYGSETKEDSRYLLITSDNIKFIHKAVERFNNKDNVHGNFIRIIIGSELISEGFSFFNIQEVYLLHPSWNYSSIDQVIARGIRFGSHKDLIYDFEKQYLIKKSDDEIKTIADELQIEGNENKLLTVDKILNNKSYVFSCPEQPKVQIYQYVAIPNKKELPSVDVKHYRISEIKDLNSKLIERLIKESAFDCPFNYSRNKSIGYDNERDCEYESCDYVCDNVLNMIPKEIDYSTDQIFYISGKENLILKSKVVDVFKNVYYITSLEIKKLSLDLDINERYIYLFLKSMVDNREIVYNKLGIRCFLYEDNNIFFLVDNPILSTNSLSSYYTEIPNIQVINREKIIKSNVDINEKIIDVFHEKDKDKLKHKLLEMKINVVELIIEEIIYEMRKKDLINESGTNIKNMLSK